MESIFEKMVTMEAYWRPTGNEETLSNITLTVANGQFGKYLRNNQANHVELSSALQDSLKVGEEVHGVHAIELRKYGKTVKEDGSVAIEPVVPTDDTEAIYRWIVDKVNI